MFIFFSFQQNISTYTMLFPLIILYFWSIPRVDSAENIALGKTATMSSAHFGYVASKAVDGNTDGNIHNGSCSHTEQSIAWHWWQVDLGKVYSVGSVVISNRHDCCSYRLANFTLELSVQDPSTLNGFPALTSDSSVCFYQATEFQASPPKTFQCTRPTIGRYLRLVKYKEFAICEVEVYEDFVVSTPTPTTTTTTTIVSTYQAIRIGKWKCVEQNQMKCSQNLAGANALKNILNCARRSLSDEPVGGAPFIQISISSGQCLLLASLNGTNTSSITDWLTYKYM